jgi:hypothetical protein
MVINWKKIIKIKLFSILRRILNFATRVHSLSLRNNQGKTRFEIPEKNCQRRLLRYCFLWLQPLVFVVSRWRCFRMKRRFKYLGIGIKRLKAVDSRPVWPNVCFSVDLRCKVQVISGFVQIMAWIQQSEVLSNQ